ncbi:MAG: hypothetical protein RQM90_11380 [Methanoculleus sp.]
MRVLAIGFGGAGSRVVDILYDHDRRSRVCCMNVVAIDIDPNSLVQLRHLPESARIFFPPIDALDPDDIMNVIDVEEVMTRIQGLDTMEIDAILLCCGLGGNVIDVAPPIVEEPGSLTWSPYLRSPSCRAWMRGAGLGQGRRRPRYARGAHGCCRPLRQ